MQQIIYYQNFCPHVYLGGCSCCLAKEAQRAVKCEPNLDLNLGNEGRGLDQSHPCPQVALPSLSCSGLARSWQNPHQLGRRPHLKICRGNRLAGCGYRLVHHSSRYQVDQPAFSTATRMGCTSHGLGNTQGFTSPTILYYPMVKIGCSTQRMHEFLTQRHHN